MDIYLRSLKQSAHLRSEKGRRHNALGPMDDIAFFAAYSASDADNAALLEEHRENVTLLLERARDLWGPGA